MRLPGGGALKRVGLESLGWLLLLAGLAMIALPGPGLLGIFAGLALLSQQYEWADRRVEPVRLRAMKGAAEGVESPLRIALSIAGVAILIACGVLWIAYPPVPAWWPLPEAVWLPGGMWTGITQIGSGIIAFALIVYSYRKYHGQPGAAAELARRIEEADRDAKRAVKESPGP